MKWLFKGFVWVDKSMAISCRVFELMAAVMVIGIVLLTVVDVSFRTAGRMSIVGVLEVTEVLMAGIVFLVLAAVQRRDQHIRIDFVVDRLPGRAQAILRSTILLLAIAISVLFLWQSVLVSYHSWLIKEFRHGLLPVPIWPARFMVTTGFFFLSVQLVIDLVRRGRQLRSGHVADIA